MDMPRKKKKNETRTAIRPSNSKKTKCSIEEGGRREKERKKNAIGCAGERS